MTYDELLEKNKTRRIDQIALLVDDMDTAVRLWTDKLGIGPWTIYTFSDKTMKDFKVNGELVEGEFEFQIGHAKVGDLLVELVMPVKGPNAYGDFMAQKGGGFHHFKEYIPEDQMESYLQELQEKGLPFTQSGWCGPDFHTYVSLEPLLGFTYEVGNCPPGIDLPEEYIRYYPEKDD